MKNKKFLLVISFITVISFIIGFSYAYFTTIVIGNDTASLNTYESESLRLTFNGVDYINMENSKPGDFESITFTVNNSGTGSVNSYQVHFSNVVNTFSVKSELVYEIECTSSDAVSCLGKVETEIPSTSGVVLNQTTIAPGTTHTYTLTVTFIDTGFPQNYNQNKTLSYKVSINDELSFSKLISSTGSADTRFFWGYKTMLTKVTFENLINIPVGATVSWDVSEVQDESIMAYIIDDGLGTSTFELFIQTNDDFVLANPNGSYLFYNFYKMTSMNNIDLLNTSYVINMYQMFYNCSDIYSLDLSTFDTALVANMGNMFKRSGSLSSLDISNFDTSHVTNMAGMFDDCGSLDNLSLASFDTTNVTDMSYMFRDCKTVKVLDLSTFNTAKVTTMLGMFNNCEAMHTIDLTSFNTSIVSNMGDVFYNCPSIFNIDLSSFDTSSVTNMISMFSDCDSLTNVDLRLADFTSVSSHTAMFANLLSNITIIVKDVPAQTFINARLTDAGKTGTVTIA